MTTRQQITPASGEQQAADRPHHHVPTGPGDSWGGQESGSPSHSAAEIVAGISHGALMGARGNSGVILSQIWRGFAEGIGGKERISAREFADGLVAATATAYRAVLKPVEGTILTIIKDTGAASQAAAG